MPLVTLFFGDLPRVLQIERTFFTHRGFFTLHSFLLFSRLLWGRQFNLKVSRASCWSLKHSPGPAICLNHNNSQNRYSGRFYLRVITGRLAWWRIWLLRDLNSFRDRWACQKLHALFVWPQRHTTCVKWKF